MKECTNEISVDEGTTSMGLGLYKKSNRSLRHIFPVYYAEGEGALETSFQQKHRYSQPFCVKLRKGNVIYFDFGGKIVARVCAQIRSDISGEVNFHICSHPDAEDALMFCAKNYDNPEWPRSKSLVGGPLTGLYEAGTNKIELKRSQAFRFLRVETTSDVDILQIKAIESRLPLQMKGLFECDDESINQAWRMGIRTTDLCVQPAEDSSVPLKGIYSKYVVWDGPRTDREIWGADVRPTALTMYYNFNEIGAIRNSLALLAEKSFADGLIPGSASSRQRYVEYAFWWIIALWDYYLHTADKHFIVEMYEAFENQMSWFKNNMASNGIVPVDKLWCYTLSRGDDNCLVALLHKKAFECASQIEQLMGNPVNAETYNVWSVKCGRFVLDNYFDVQSKMFYDCRRSEENQKRVLEDINVLAVLFELVKGEDAIDVLENTARHLWTPNGAMVSNPPYAEKNIFPDQRRDAFWMHNSTIWPYMNAYEVGAWFKAGAIDKGLDLLKRYTGACLRKDTNTIWECIPKNGELNVSPDKRFAGSVCHAWGGTASYYLMKYVLGVHVAEAGFKKVRIVPNLGRLKWIRGKVSTPYGCIELEISKKASDTKINVLSCPKDIVIAEH